MRTANPNIWLAMCVFLLATTCTAVGQTITVDDNGPADFDNIQVAKDDAMCIMFSVSVGGKCSLRFATKFFPTLKAKERRLI